MIGHSKEGAAVMQYKSPSTGPSIFFSIGACPSARRMMADLSTLTSPFSFSSCEKETRRRLSFWTPNKVAAAEEAELLIPSCLPRTRYREFEVWNWASISILGSFFRERGVVFGRKSFWTPSRLGSFLRSGFWDRREGRG